jgi:hypothetical protein
LISNGEKYIYYKEFGRMDIPPGTSAPERPGGLEGRNAIE